jgi:hypothetical protein
VIFLVVIVRSSPPPDYNHRPEFSSDWNSSATRLHRWDNEWDYVDLAFKVLTTLSTHSGGTHKDILVLPQLPCELELKYASSLASIYAFVVPCYFS